MNFQKLDKYARLAGAKGAQLVVTPEGFLDGYVGNDNEIMMRTRAYENSVYVAFVHPQRALIIDPRGAIIAQDDKTGGDQIVTATITVDDRVGRGVIQDRRPEIYGEILSKKKIVKQK